jgi:hypothetical protein
MRGKANVLYWATTGALVGFGLIGLTSNGFPFVVAGLVMAVVGVRRPGISGAWGFLIGFGGLPALVLLLNIVEGARTALNPYCAQPGGPGTQIPPQAGPVECALIPGSYYVMFATFTAIALLGVVLGLLLHARSRTAAA